MIDKNKIIVIAERAAEKLMPDLLGSKAARLSPDMTSAYKSLIKNKVTNAIADAIAEVETEI